MTRLTRPQLLQRTVARLVERGYHAELRRHYPHPYIDHRVVSAVLTDAGPIEVGLAWREAHELSNTPFTASTEKLLELCKHEHLTVFN